jgi:fumarate reductase subunit C
MEKPERVVPLRRTDESGNGQRPVSGFMFRGQALSMPIARPQGASLAKRLHRPAWAALSAPVLDVATSISGAALTAFLLMHMVLLSSVLAGATTLDALAEFLERYYLLHIGAPPLILLLLAHVVLVTRKAPTTFRQQWTLVRQLRQMTHLDTWTWAFQVVSGAALMVFASIHLWVSLTELPIEAAKSGDRVSTFLWFDILFVLFVVGHAFIGLYRITVKWGLLSRRGAYAALATLTAVVLAVEFAIVSSFFTLGGGQ